MVHLSNPYMTTGKTIALTRQNFISKVTSLLLNRLSLSRFVITCLPRSKCLFISRLQSPSAVILETKKRKSGTVSIISFCICHELMRLDVMILVFWKLSLSQQFHSPFSLSSRGSSAPFSFLPLGWYIWGYWYFSQQSWFQLVLPSSFNFAWCPLHIS